MKKVLSAVLSVIMLLSVFMSLPVISNAATQVELILNRASYLAANSPHAYDGECLSFCTDCYRAAGYTGVSMGTAYNAGTQWIQSTSSSNIPVGALVFYDLTWHETAGHVGIYAGNGKMYDAESRFGGIKLRNFRTDGYRGWGWYNRIPPTGSTYFSTEKPSVYANNKKFAIGNNVTFSFYAPNADSIYLGLYLNGQMYFNGEFSPNATYTRTLTQKGHYAFFIVAHYPGGDIESDWNDFDVYDSLSAFIPAKPDVWTNGDRFAVGTDITVHHWAELSRCYSVSVYRNNVLLKNEHIYTGTSEINYTTPGVYEIVVVAINDYGESEKGSASFTLYNSVPDKPDVWVDGETLETETDIVIHHWANLARRYVVTIYKDNTLIKSEENYSSTYTTTFSNPGSYRIIASAFNEFGESEHAQISINVICKSGTHSYQSEVIAPTCKEGGYTIFSCSKCGYSYVTNKTNKTNNHNYKLSSTKSATCTETGTKKYTCTVCGETKTETIKATGHTEETVKGTPATFKSAGKTDGKKCKVCGKILVAQKKIDKLGAPSLSKVTAGKKQFKATWKSIKSIDGYQIQYSTSSSFKSGNKTVTVSGYKSTSKTVKSLKAKKKYYVRIRGYKTIDGKKQYSAWSKSKTVTTKK